MALKDLLVYVDQTDDALTRLRLAADLAACHGARLTALFVREWSQHRWDRRKAAELGLVSAEKIAQLDEHTRASIESIADRFRTTLVEVTAGRGVDADLQSLDGTAVF
jgi:nucleotide-binding universal stress UspA family protein